MDYKNGKIYKLISDETDFVYVGSTTQPLAKRLYTHKSFSKRGTTSKVYRIMNEIGADNFRIILIKNFPCDSKEQLCAEEEMCRKKINEELLLNTNRCYVNVPKNEYMKEYNPQYYIEHSKTIKGQVHKYRIENLDKIRETKAKYHIQNRETIKEKQKLYYDANREALLANKCQYRDDNREKIRESDNRRYHQNKEKILEKRKETIECSCGSLVTKVHLKRHEKTKKHLNYIELHKDDK